MLKKNKILVLVVLMLFSFSLGSFAGNNLEKIEAYINHGLSVKFEGLTQEFTDANGEVVKPVTINGSTYLPVRAVAEMTGLEVGWDGATQTVTLKRETEEEKVISNENLENFEYTKGSVSNSVTITKYVGDAKEIIIPETIEGLPVKSIAKEAFTQKGDWGSYKGILTSVTLPETLETIGENAFRENELRSIIIPNSVIEIGERAFQSNNLEEIVLPDQLKVIPNYAFSGNKLVEINIPNSVENIGSGSFSNNNLVELNIPNSVEEIGASSFYKNKLMALEISESVTYIGESAFYENELTSVVIPSSIKTINDSTFKYNNLNLVEIPDSVTSIGDGSFENNNLKEVYISKETEYMNDFLSQSFDEHVNVIRRD